jgi:hypothetical protein
VGQARTGHRAFSPRPPENPEKDGRTQRAEERPQ